MGKIRVATLGSGEETEQRRRASARRQTKKAKKAKVEGVGLKGGERVAVVEGTEIRPEFQRLVKEVEEGKTAQTEEKAPKKRKTKIRARSKRYQSVFKLVNRARLYPLAEAIELVKKTSLTKFDGTVELHINLNLGALDGKSDWRGSVKLPHGTGKQVKVAIADDNLLSEIEAGKINFDILVAHPSMMPRLAKVARILGPKGLMPNPKTGTVGENPEQLASSLSKGQVNFKTEPDQPIIHLTVGKVSFTDKQLSENIKTVLEAVGKSKIAKTTLSATMGPGVKVALA